MKTEIALERAVLLLRLLRLRLPRRKTLLLLRLRLDRRKTGLLMQRRRLRLRLGLGWRRTLILRL